MRNMIAWLSAIKAQRRNCAQRRKSKRNGFSIYEEKSYLYGRQAQDNKSHTAALLSRYERAVEDNVKLAAHHRNMAAELAKGNYAASDRQDDGREIKAKIGEDAGNRL